MKETVKKLKFPRMSRIVFLFGFCVILGVAISGCSLKAPGDLSWDTHLSVPLGVRTYGLGDLVMTDAAIQDSGSGIGMYDSSNTTDATLYGKLFFSSYNRFDVRLVDSLIVDAFERDVVKPVGITNYNGLANLPVLQHRIRRALVDSCYLTMRLQNIDNSTSGLVTVKIPNFVSSAGDTLTIPLANVSNVARDTVINLHNYYVDLDTSQTPQQIALNIVTTLTPNVRATMSLTRMKMINYSGIVDHLAINGLSSSTDVDSLPQGWEAIHPTAVDGYVHMKHSVTATANVDLNVASFVGSGLVASRNIVTNGLYMGRDTSTVTHGLEAMITQFPTRVTAEATMELNGPIANCTGSDTVRLDVELRAPLSFTLDPMHAHGDQDIREIKNNELKSINAEGSYLRVKIWNHLPVGGHVYFVADSIQSRVLFNSGADVDTIFSVDVPIPELDAHGNVVGDILIPEFRIDLTPETVALFKTGDFFARTDIDLNGSSSALIANAQDYIKVQIVAEIERRVNSKGDDEE
jgi:hypothetical protein